MTDYRLSELLDMRIIQTLAESNYRAGGLPMSIIDAFDTSILVSAGWQDICTKFHRVNRISHARCLESDNHVKDHVDSRVPYQYKCKNGIWHIAVPLVAAGHHLATMFLTQFNFEGEGPDREFFIRQAHEFGYNLDDYLNALDRMPTFSAEKVSYILAYDMAIAQFITDLAEQSLKIVETEKSLSKSEDKYRSVVENINIGIYRNTVGQGRFHQINPAMAKMFGYDSEEEMMHTAVVTLYQNAPDRIKFIEEVKQKGFVKDRELAMLKKDGTPIWCSATATAQYDKAGNIKWMDGVIEDITERKQAEERLQKAFDELDMRVRERTADLAEANELLIAEIAERKRAEEKLRELSETDHLTKIYNRRKLLELLGTEVAKAKRYARPLTIVMLDIDHFKKINDNYGHSIGDIVLKITTNIVGGIIRKVDIFARYGGEEFMILSPETGMEGALVMAEKIRVAVETYSYPAGVSVTISAGVAEWSRDDSVAAFIKKVDETLYVAKNRGRNRVEAAERPA